LFELNDRPRCDRGNTLTTRLYILFAIAAFASLPVGAQITTIHGVVTDENGAVVSGVHVTVRSDAGIEFETRTNDLGAFLGTVKTRIVSIEISADGFLKRQLRDYQLPNSSIVDLGTIVIKVGQPIIDLAPVPEGPPVEIRESSASSEIQNRKPAFKPYKETVSGFSLAATVTLTGIVYDPVGAVVPNTPVVAKDSRGHIFKGISGSNGTYQIKLPINANPWKDGVSTYEVSAGKENYGFKRTIVKNLKLAASETGVMRLDLVLVPLKVRPRKYRGARRGIYL